MTTYSWVLIIAMYSPAGDFMSQDIVKLDSRRTCEAIRAQLPSLDHPMRVKHKGLCVTKDHWEGKKQMPGVAYD
jgi:hypothetical protein